MNKGKPKGLCVALILCITTICCPSDSHSVYHYIKDCDHDDDEECYEDEECEYPFCNPEPTWEERQLGIMYKRKGLYEIHHRP